MGKTTIIDKIAYDWAVGSVALGHFTLLFVLQMSALNQTSDLVDSVFDQLLSDDTKVNKCDLEAFIKNNGSSVLILVDGLDEFRTTNLDQEKYGPILRMLNQKVCRECFVIVTTRPSQFAILKSNSLLTTSFIHVKLLGFSKKDIEKYARNVFTARRDMAEGLLDRIQSSNVLSDLARSPMLLLLMCIFWRENATLPDTLSRLFSEAIRHVFRTKMPELSEEAISEVVIAIGKVALEGLVSPEQRLSFQEGEFEKSTLDKAIQAGILTSQRVTKGLDTLQFTHKTLQEYCAAMYCQSLLSKGGGEFQTILAKIGHPWNFEYMLRFCCSDNQQCTRHILGMLHKKAIDPTVKELALNCYFESQSRDLLSVDFIESFFIESMMISEFSNYSLNSLVWFLKHVAEHTEPVGHLAKVRSITFIDCDLSSSSEILALGLTSMKNLRDLHSQGINLSDSAKDWAFQLGGIQFLEALRLGTRAASSHSVIPLKKLTLRYSNIDSPDLKYIVKSVSSMGNLVDCEFGRVPKVLRVQPFDNGIRLSISKFSLTGGDMADILRPFSNRSDLVSLILRDIDGLGGSADIWIPILQHLTHLKELRLTNCPLQSTDIEHLAAAVSQMFPVQSLSFEGNRSSRGSAKALAPSFK
ncbi:NLR family CARD domain-containing protein 4-like [Patiria miniata]|uniref:NACHT domain-containing protein n=1 Tax=Patiria miniata TaxID=46514 RepID=A0A913ZP61_PATMI|nr:NLR family CARD domain-containing protein 4-like [Patiria miniata]